MTAKRTIAAKAEDIEIQGIKVHVCVDPSDDYELSELMLIRMDDDTTPRERSEATIKTYKLILGDQYERVKNELREKNGGKLTNTTMIGFMNELVNKSAALKN